MVKNLGREGLLRERIVKGYFLNIGGVYHLNHSLLSQYRHSVCLCVCVWGGGVQESSALERAPQKSTLEHIPFLRDQFPYMVEKGQLVLKL